MKLALFISLIYLALPQEVSAEACPFVTRENLQAIDAALPCTNFVDFDGANTNSSLQRDLVMDLRQGVYGDLVSRNKVEAGCRANVFNQKIRNAVEMEQIYNEIADRFVHYRSALSRLRSASARDQQLTDMAVNGTPRGDIGASGFRGAMGAGLAGRELERERQRDQLIARIPYGFEPHVADAIRQLDEELPDNFPTTEEQVYAFKNKIYSAFVNTQNSYSQSVTHFNSLWRDTNCHRQTPQGITSLVRTMSALPASCNGTNPRSSGLITNPSQWVTCTCPSGYVSSGGTAIQEEGTWRALSMSGSIKSLADEINHPFRDVQGRLRQTVRCNADQYAADQEALSSKGILIGLVGIIPGAGPLAAVGLASVVYGDQIISSCYGGQATGFRVVNGTSCTSGMGLQSAVHAADTTDCGAAVLNLVGATAFSGAVGSARGVLSSLRGAARGSVDDVVRAAAGSNLDEVARLGSSGVDDAGSRAVRTGTDTNSGGVTSGGRQRSAGAIERSVDDLNFPEPDVAVVSADELARLRNASLPEPLPSSSRARRLVDQKFRDENVRLTDEQERLISEETFARKREIDELIGGRPGRDIHQEHAELNRFLEGPGTYEENIARYIQARGFTGARAERLRESVRILQRERTVLTRARVNRDLDAARAAGADVKTVPCGDVNALNDTLAFHDRARCSVIRFKTAVENYCSCGGRGTLGSWAGPCAQAFEDYLTAGELADRDALPGDSARGLRECRRIRIPAGVPIVHGGLRPTMSGHGGAAQVFIPSRGLKPRVPRGAPEGTPPSRARLDETSSVRTGEDGLGITDDEIINAPEIDVIAVAPLHPSREVTEIFNAGRECRMRPRGCTPEDISNFRDEFNRYARRNPEEISSEARQQFQEWTEWLRNCRPIEMGGGSSFGAYDRFRPGCRN